MTIEGSFYRLTPVGETAKFFDLELLHEVKGKTTRHEFKNAGYGMTFESAVESIIRYATCNKFKDQAITLKEYLDEYKTQKEDLQRYLRGGNA